MIKGSASKKSAAQSEPQRGRPPLPEELVKDVTIRARVTREQAEKFERLGGAEWVRYKIDEAPEPKPIIKKK